MDAKLGLTRVLGVCVALVLLAAPVLNAADKPVPVKLTLDWNPEPEFGGFYAAKSTNLFEKHGLDVALKPTGEGAPMWQLIAAGKTDFATTSADQVLIARSQGADVVALFAVYQTCPQGIMVHKARNFQSIADVFSHAGTLEAEDATWLQYCRKKYGTNGVKVIADSGGIAQFLAKPNDSMQCFVTSEPIQAKAKNAQVQAFLIADAGYNPYTTVVITSGEMIRKNPARAAAMVEACKEGWAAYLADPKPANAVMGAINKDMDAATFTAAANAQKPLIETDETKKGSLGMMTTQRWEDLSKQLVDLGVIKRAVAAKDCFVTGDQLK